jgi:hypothetical protein
MIPVRVPADAAIHIAKAGIEIPPDHPLSGIRCPVCDISVMAEPTSLVYVGTQPEDRRGRYWTGAGVVVHDSCASPGPGSDVQLREEVIAELAAAGYPATGDVLGTVRLLLSEIAAAREVTRDGNPVG